MNQNLLKTFFLIERFLTTKDLDNCILINKNFCKEIVKHNTQIIKRRCQDIHRRQWTILNAYILYIQNSSFMEESLKQKLNTIKKYNHLEFTEYMKLFYDIPQTRQTYHFENELFHYEAIFEKINERIPCLSYFNKSV